MNTSNAEITAKNLAILNDQLGAEANLRQNLKSILTEEHSIHENLYNIMNQKGWYPTSDAEAQEVQKTKDRFNSLQV